MSRVSTSPPPSPPPDETDPYRYGWRYVRVEKPDGTEGFDQVPLTLEDVLFPEVGDFIVQSTVHNHDLVYLKNVFEARLAGLRALVISDCRVDWNLPGVRPLGPDIAVFLGLEEYREWSTLDVAAEGARPVLVIEVSSPDTRKNDLEPKFDYYARARVPMYVIADAIQEDEHGRRIELTAYRLTRGRYRKVRPDARGWIRLEAVGVWLGVKVDPRTGCDRLACYDQQGRELGDYAAVSRALVAEAAARAEAEARRAEAAIEARARAEERIRELEAALRRGQGPPPPP